MMNNTASNRNHSLFSAPLPPQTMQIHNPVYHHSPQSVFTINTQNMRSANAQSFKPMPSGNAIIRVPPPRVPIRYAPSAPHHPPHFPQHQQPIMGHIMAPPPSSQRFPQPFPTSTPFTRDNKTTRLAPTSHSNHEMIKKGANGNLSNS